MAWSVRNRSFVIAVALLATVGSLATLLLIEPNLSTDVQAGVFPADDPQAEAFRELREKVAGINAEIVYAELLPDARAPNGTPIERMDDLAALYAVEELFQYIDTRYQEITGRDDVIDYGGYGQLIKLVNSYFPDTSTIPPGEGGFELPRDQRQYELSQMILESTGDDVSSVYFSDDGKAGIFLILYEPGERAETTAGHINQIIAEYRETPAEPGSLKTFEIWKDEYLDSWGIQSWIYRVDEAVEKDLNLLTPIVFGVLILLLVFAYRSVGRAMMTMAMVGLVLTWTLAAMTLLGLSIGFISMALFPLLLGVGVDYALHVVHDVMGERVTRNIEGKKRDVVEQAMQHAGGKAGTALVISTLTTVAGFAVIMLSRSPMIVEVSTATIIGMSLMLVASLTLLPAMLSIAPLPKKASTAIRPDNVAGRLGSLLQRRRVVTGLFVGLLVVGILPFTPQTEFSQETVQVNLPSRPEPSHMLVMFDRFASQMRSDGQEAVITRGDMTSPIAIRDIANLHTAMEEEEFFPNSVTSLAFVLELYETLESGGDLGPIGVLPSTILNEFYAQSGMTPPQELEFLGACAEPFCRARALSQEEIRANYDSMFEDERWRNIIESMVDEDYSISWTFSFIDVPATDETTTDANAAMNRIIESADPETDAKYFGTLTALYRINLQAKEWLTLSAIVDVAVLGALMAFVTRSLRATLTAMLILTAGMATWLGILALPFVDIEINFVYLIPLAFITSLGSDYAVHYTLACEQSKRDRKEAYARVGRAVIFSSLTTVVAFSIFTLNSIQGSWQMFQATCIAILVSAFLTLTIVPIAYPERKDDGSTPTTQDVS